METAPHNALAQELVARGLIFQHSADLDLIFGTTRTIYLGVDPTADSMHAGNLITYIVAERMKRAGHNVILLVGGATGLIGDPSHKDTERPLSSTEEVAKRAELIREQIKKIAGLSDMPIVNNYDWFKSMNFLEFLRDVGKYFTVNQMMKRDSVSRRLESEEGISYTEFTYALLQGYDYYVLHKEKGCDLEIGGSDQWGNIISGVDYIRKKTGDTVFGITIPLIVDKSTGKKFGKSEGNAIWLDPVKLSPYNFHQFWLRTDDATVIEYLKFFTFLSLEDIASLESEMKEHPEARSAQRALAREVTTFVHGEKIASDVEKVAELLYTTQSFDVLDADTLALINTYVPIVDITQEDTLLSLLVEHSFASSNREGREFIENGAIRINGEKATSETNLGDIHSASGLVMIARGNKQKALFRLPK